jgi:hypothetical protein
LPATTRLRLLATLGLALPILLTTVDSQARTRRAPGPKGAAWKANAYWPDALGQLQGAAHRTWSKQAKGWLHPAASASEDNIEEWWCRGARVSESMCWTGAVTGMLERDVSWRGMGADLRDGTVQRMWLTAGELPQDATWGVSVRVEVSGTPLRVDDFELKFMRFVGVVTTETVVVAPVIGHTVEQTDFKSSPLPRGPGVVDFLDLTSSSSSLGDAAVLQVNTLLARVLRGLAQGEAKKCSYGRYHGDEPPPCRLVSLQPIEVRDWGITVERQLSHRSELIRAESDLLHPLLLSLFPHDITQHLDGPG